MKEARRVIFLILPTVQTLDLAGPVQAFAEAQALGAGYKLIFCGPKPDVRSAQHLCLTALVDYTTIEVRRSDLIIIPGIDGDRLSPRDLALGDRLIRWLREAHAAGAVLCSVCNAAFVLAEAGLLRNRSCTTHWRRVEQLARAYAGVHVLEDRLFVKDQNVYSSAGICSGIDLSLSIIEDDYGPALTARVARDLVIYMRRSANDRQLSAYLDYRDHLDPAVHRVQDWIAQHPGSTSDVSSLADVACMSVRNLSRVFKKATGLTLKEYSNKIRLEYAATLMNNPKLTIDAISQEAGFRDPRQFRRLWKSTHRVSPTVSRTILKSHGQNADVADDRRVFR